MKQAIGIDIGATYIRIAIVNEFGTITSLKTEKTIKNNLDGFINQITNLIKEVLINSQDVSGIGIGIPGPITPYSGYVPVLPNIGLKDFNLIDRLRPLTNLPIVLLNDANAAAYGEAILGSGKGFNLVQYITLSTGVGGGLVYKGQIYSGKHGHAQEIGNMIINLNQPKPNIHMNQGSFEAWCSGSSLIRMAKEIGIEVNHAGQVFSNEKCTDIVNLWIKHLAIAISNLATLYEPDIFILGGGLMQSSSYFLDRLNREIKQYLFGDLEKFIKIAPAQLVQNAGIIGSGLAIINQNIFINLQKQ